FQASHLNGISDDGNPLNHILEPSAHNNSRKPCHHYSIWRQILKKSYVQDMNNGSQLIRNYRRAKLWRTPNRDAVAKCYSCQHVRTHTTSRLRSTALLICETSRTPSCPRQT